MKQKLLIALGLCIMALLVLAPVGASAKAPDTIKIGAVYEITGPIAATGERVTWGLRKAVEVINKDGGIFVKEFNKKIPIQLVEADHTSNVDKAALQAEYVNQQDVVAIVGSTAFLPAGGAVAQKYNIPVLMILSNNKTPHELGYKYLFSNWTKSDAISNLVVSFFNSLPKDKRPSNIAIFEGMHDIGVEQAKFFEKAASASGYKTTRIKFEWMAKDLSAAIMEAKRINADAIYTIMHTPVAMLLIRQMKELDFNPKAAYIDMGPTNPIAWKSLGKDGEFIYAGMNFLKGVTWPGAKEFIAMHEAERPKDVNYFEHASIAYSAIQIIADAITRAGSLDRKKIRDALAATNMMTITGPVKFNADGTLETSQLNIVQYQGGVQTIVFPESRRQKPPIYPMPTWKER